MELALYKFEVNNTISVYVGYKNQVPNVAGKLIGTLELPPHITLDLLIGGTLGDIVIQPADYLKGTN